MEKINDFIEKTRPRSDKKRLEKKMLKKNLYNFYDGIEMVLYAFKSKIFLATSK